MCEQTDADDALDADEQALLQSFIIRDSPHSATSELATSTKHPMGQSAQPRHVLLDDGPLPTGEYRLPIPYLCISQKELSN